MSLFTTLQANIKKSPRGIFGMLTFNHGQPNTLATVAFVLTNNNNDYPLQMRPLGFVLTVFPKS